MLCGVDLHANSTAGQTWQHGDGFAHDMFDDPACKIYIGHQTSYGPIPLGFAVKSVLR